MFQVRRQRRESVPRGREVVTSAQKRSGRCKLKTCPLTLTTRNSWVNLAKAFSVDQWEEKPDWVGG